MNRIQPDLHLSLVCDDVRQENNGKRIFIGNFDRISARSFPAMHARMVVVNRWGNGTGDFEDQVRIVGPLNAILAETPPVRIRLGGERRSHFVEHVLQGLVFPAPGLHWVEVLLDRDLKGRYPIEVALIQA